jgi:hypothetical protein
MNESAFEIESLEIPTLESKIVELYDGYMESGLQDDDIFYCLTDILQMRKDVINEDIEFTPLIVSQIERVNNLLISTTSKTLLKAMMMVGQLKTLKNDYKDFQDEFIIEIQLGVAYTDEDSLLTLDTDENEGVSNYQAMSEILKATSGQFKCLRRFIFSEMDSGKSFFDESLRQNWNFGILGAPELRDIKYVGYATHLLFTDTNYSISDIIRIKESWSEVKISWNNKG